ncbi:MAG: sporulation factor SpoIIGA [Peptococcaceae bacterium]|nr:sporulation factor SpoIIGA [Peptococcaceae bacterium]
MEETGLTAHVYVDVVFLVNLIMDFFILWATGKIGKIRMKMVRVFLGALFGAFYSLVIFFPEWPALTSLLVKVLCSLVMVLIAFAPLPLGSFIRSLGYLYLVSFAMGGAVMGAIYLTNNSPGYVQAWNGAAVIIGNIHYGWLSVAIGMAILLGVGGLSYVRKNWLQENLMSQIILTFGSDKVILQALLDTGNQLVDPLTQKPVIVAEVKALHELIPREVVNIVNSGEEIRLPELTSLIDPQWSSRLRIIPFNSVGRSNGLMLGFRPDAVEIRYHGKMRKTGDVIVGLVNKKLSNQGRYQALLHPELLE